MRLLRSILAGCAFALVIVAIIAVGVRSYLAADSLAANTQAVITSQKVMESLAGMHADLAEIDRGATAYALTGSELLLPVYELAIQQKDRKLALLRDAMQGDSAQLAALDKLDPLVARRCATAAQMIRVHREQGPDAARQIVLSGDAARLMDQIQSALESLRIHEAERLAARLAQAHDSTAVMQHNVLNGALVSLGAAAALIAALIRYLAGFSGTKHELETREMLTRSLIDSIPDAIYVKDAKGRFMLANKAHRKILTGDENKAVEGRTVFDFATPHAAEVQDRDDQAVIRARRAFVDRTERGGLPGEPETKWLQTTRVPLFDKKGDCLAIYGINRDVTQLRLLQEEVEKLKVAVEQAARAKTDFLANMSHEIRTPMNGILGMIELGLDTELTDQQREYLSLCKNSAQALLDLLNDILDYTRGEVGAISLENVPFDLQEVITQVVTPLTARALEKHLRLTWRCAADVPRWLRGDPNRLRQVLVNLVGNAIKFTDVGEIFLEIRQESGKRHETTLQFSVRDTGVGVPETKREEIFEAFNQADTSHTRQYGGTGLGLTISASLVKLMGGRIWLDSTVEVGSTFFFTAIFGISEEIKPAKRVDTSGAGVRSAVSGLSVLVVDHDYTSRRVLEDLLLTWQMKPKVVVSGPVALDELWQAFQDGNPFPLVLVDARMPQMDGFELSRLIKREPELQGTRIILLSSVPELLNSEKVHSVGIDAAFPKPVRPPDLLEAINRMFSEEGAPPPFAWGSGAIVTPETGNGATEPAPSAKRNDEGERTCRSLVVLVAEDNPVNQAVAAGVLGKRGHKALRANNGQEAVTMFETHSVIDVILMDIQMPEMDGHSATKNIRRLETGTGRHVPIIAVTAHAMKGDRERCLASGMDAYLSKPFPKEELVRLVESFAAGPEGSLTQPKTDFAAVASVSSPNQETPAGTMAEPATGTAPVTAPPKAPVARRVSVFSREQLVENLGDEDLVGTLIDIFLDQTPKLLTELDSALASKNAVLAERTAHSLKGSSGNFGAKNAWQLAQTVEYAGRGGDLSGAAESAKQLSEELQLVMAALKEIR